MVKRALVLALAASALLAQTAAAGTLVGTPKLFGAGQVVPVDSSVFPQPSCRQAAPVASWDGLTCPSWSVSGAIAQVSLLAVPEPGWQFSGWLGCDAAHGTRCDLTVPADQRSVAPVAAFVDHTPPTVTGLAASSHKDGIYTVDWQANEPGVTYSCLVDGMPGKACAPGDDFTLAPGAHTITVLATDPSNNVGTNQLALVAIDTTLDGLKAGTVGGDTIDCSLDHGPWTPCGGQLPPLAEGEHTLLARGRKGANVDLTPASYTWTVDTKAPDTFLTDAPGGFKLSSDEAGVTFKCTLDGSPVDCATVLTPGAHTFTAAAVDRAGNVDPTPARRSWTLPAPQTIVVATPAPAAAPFQLTYTFRKHRFTAISANAPVLVTLKAPHRPAVVTTLARLRNQKLADGTKIVVRAATATKTLVIRHGAV